MDNSRSRTRVRMLVTMCILFVWGAMLPAQASVARSVSASADHPPGATVGTSMWSRDATAGRFQGCVLRVLDSSRVTVGRGVRVYVEPSTFDVADGAMLVLGVPSYVTSKDARGRWRVVRDSVVGAVRLAGDRWRTIESPLPGRYLFDPRASRRGTHTWDVVFLELPRPFDPRTSDSTIGVWHAVLDGSRWRQVQRLPMPASIQPHLLSASSLLRTSDTLSWVDLHGEGRANAIEDATIAEFHDGRWTWRRFGAQVSWVQVVNDQRGIRRLLVAQWKRRGSRDVYAIRLYTLDRSPRELAAVEADKPRSFSVTQSGPDGFLVAYQAEDGQGVGVWQYAELHADGTTVGPSVVGGSIERLHAIAAPDAGRPATLLADLGDSIPAQLAWRLYTSSADTARQRATWFKPFRAAVPIKTYGAHRAVIVGPAFESSASRRILHTLVMSVGIECRDVGSG